ncbi:MAG: sulfatase-like hydrolase/transferase, partial [Planctomycetota bacterium]|nr:sulfatase-like hydrolase/transferase [Planctomycetota bacterium]
MLLSEQTQIDGRVSLFLKAERFCVSLAGVLFAALIFAASQSAAIAATAPNILFIMSDDHAAHAIGAYGSRLAGLNPTPNIDRLAKEGARLTNCFCTNSICTPSRATIITGQYSHGNGVTTLNGSIEPARQTLALQMKKAGYE